MIDFLTSEAFIFTAAALLMVGCFMFCSKPKPPNVTIHTTNTLVHSDLETDIIDLINLHRLSINNNPLLCSDKLKTYAGKRLDDVIMGTFDHSLFDVGHIIELGFNYGGENLSKGYPTATSIIEAWMESTEGHYENMGNKGWEYIGVKSIHGSEGVYTVVIFGR